MTGTTPPPVPEDYGNAREQDRAVLAGIRERNPDWELPEPPVLPDSVEALHRRALDVCYTAINWDSVSSNPLDGTDIVYLAGLLAAHAVLSEGTAS